MNIGIDCIALPAKFSGAANYIINLSRNLLRTERSYSIQIYCREEHSHLFRRYLGQNDTLIEIKISNRLQKLFYYEKYLSKMLIKCNTNIFLATHYITPPRSVHYKIISIFHDMGFILHKEYYSIIKQKYFKIMIPQFIYRSDKIVTVSQSTLKDLNNTFSESRPKALCIYPGTDHLKSIKSKALKISVESNMFILAVNVFEKRKNIPFIIDVFNILKRDYKINHNLIFVGRSNNGFADFQYKYNNSPYKKNIFILHDIDVRELKNLYSNASLFLNASAYEGFGFTPVEAISQRCPVFLYPNNVCQELFSDHPYLIDSFNPNIWAEKIYSEMKNNYVNKISYDRLSGLSWQKCALNFNSLFNVMLGKRNVQRRHLNYNKSYSKLRQRS